MALADEEGGMSGPLIIQSSDNAPLDSRYLQICDRRNVVAFTETLSQRREEGRKSIVHYYVLCALYIV